jgi:hypothetical protein
MIVIDRKDGNKIYYVNKKRYSFHKDFVNGTYLSLERGREFFQNNYLNANRRFILGTLAYQFPLKRWTFEFWEGDLIPADQIQLAYDVIAQRRERIGPHSHHSEARRSRRDRLQRNSRTRRSAGSLTTGRRYHNVATFNAAFTHQPARQRLGHSQRLHQEREGAVEAVRRLVGLV